MTGGSFTEANVTSSEVGYMRGAEWMPLNKLDEVPSSTKSFDWKAVVRAAIT